MAVRQAGRRSWSRLIGRLQGGLAKAVRKEANQAVQYWWGVGNSTVRKWRKTLEVPLTNAGTSQLRSEYFQEDWAKARDPVRRAKIAAARRGKKRPTPAMQAGVVDRLWSFEDLFEAVTAGEKERKSLERYKSLAQKLKKFE